MTREERWFDSVNHICYSIYERYQTAKTVRRNRNEYTV